MVKHVDKVPGTYERVHQSSDRRRKDRPWFFRHSLLKELFKVPGTSTA